MLTALEFVRARCERWGGVGFRLGAWAAGLVAVAVVACAGFAGVVLTTGRLIELQLGLDWAAGRPGDGVYEGFGEGFGALSALAGDGAAVHTELGEEAARRPALVQTVAAASDMGKRFYSGDGDTYRTVCVRLCDGFYWTMSFSTTEDRFARDQGRCEASCGVPARLFKYRNPGGRPEAMEDLDGQPYAKLKTAFAFRKAYDAACRCQANPWDREARMQHRLYELAAHKGASDPSAKAEQETLKRELADTAARRMEQGRVAIAAWQKLPVKATRVAAAARPRKAERPRPTRLAKANSGTATDADEAGEESGESGQAAVVAAARPAGRPGLMRLGGTRPSRGAAAPAVARPGSPPPVRRASVRTADWRQHVFSSVYNH